MVEYIDREALLRDIEKYHVDFSGKFQHWIEIQPTADVAPIVHGYWIKDEASYYPDDYYCVYYDYECSNCGKTVNDRHRLPKYCPECGSRNEMKK